MRDYGKVSPQFWIGDTGKKLRGSPQAQVLALYLMTCPHSRMSGVFHCPTVFMSHETGIPLEGVSKGLQRLSEVGFCEYSEETESVFVFRMAAYQIGEELKEADNRIVGLRKEYKNMPEGRIKSKFFELYGDAFYLNVITKSDTKNKAPSKPLRSQKQEQEQEQNKTSHKNVAGVNAVFSGGRWIEVETGEVQHG